MASFLSPPGGHCRLWRRDERSIPGSVARGPSSPLAARTGWAQDVRVTAAGELPRMTKKYALSVFRTTTIGEHGSPNYFDSLIWERLKRNFIVGLQAIEPLWVSGLALLCLIGGHFVWTTIVRLSGEAYDWAEYLT